MISLSSAGAALLQEQRDAAADRRSCVAATTGAAMNPSSFVPKKTCADEGAGFVVAAILPQQDVAISPSGWQLRH
ncbi:hypothetical protein [Stenotrophomonas humi]